MRFNICANLSCTPFCDIEHCVSQMCGSAVFLRPDPKHAMPSLSKGWCLSSCRAPDGSCHGLRRFRPHEPQAAMSRAHTRIGPEEFSTTRRFERRGHVATRVCGDTVGPLQVDKANSCMACPCASASGFAVFVFVLVLSLYVSVCVCLCFFSF